MPHDVIAGQCLHDESATCRDRGGGFAGLAAACALAQRGWSVRVHERGTELRTAGAGIYIYENGLRVLEALGAFDDAVKGASAAQTREVRDERNRVVSTHKWNRVGRVYSVVRQRLIDALADAARRAGAEIVTGSEAASATAEGRLSFTDGGTVTADLVIGADGVNSKIRDSIALLARRKAMPDGAIRVLLPKTGEERAAGDTGTTIEYWSGSRRILYTPCSDDEIYVALTMLDKGCRRQGDTHRQWALERGVPAPCRSGRPRSRRPLRPLRTDQAHALVVGTCRDPGRCRARAAAEPRAGRRLRDDERAGAGGASRPRGRRSSGLAAWEAAERPLTEHTQRMSVFFGIATTWPAPLQRLFFSLAGRSALIGEMRTRTARHIPTGTAQSAVATH